MTGVFKHSIFGGLEEILQENIDYWCSLCQFPLAEEMCKDKALIQQCWDESQAIAGKWHIQRECPFAHKGQECRCNDFKDIEDAFRFVGQEYKRKGGDT